MTGRSKSATGKKVGTLHTHPYTNGLKNVAHSDDDIFSAFKGNAGNKGFTVMLESGDKRFAVVVLDPEKAIKFLNRLNESGGRGTYVDNYKGSAEMQEFNATLAVVGNGNVSGLGFYQTMQGDKKNLAGFCQNRIVLL